MSERALPPADLSSAFAKSPRAAGLRLPPAKATAPAPQDNKPVRAVPDLHSDVIEEQPTPAIVRKATRKKSTTKRAASTAPTRVAGASLILWTLYPLRQRMQSVRQARGMSYLDQVLDALETNADNLSELVNKTPTVTKGRLFERQHAAAQPVQDTKGGRVQLTIRGVLQSQLDVIDELCESIGCSRSALCNAALDAWLPKS